MWLTDDISMTQLKDQLDLASLTSKNQFSAAKDRGSSEKALRGKFKLENGSCIDHLGQNLVDQVFYEQRISSLVVEVADKTNDAFLLSTDVAPSSFLGMAAPENVP